MREIYKDFHPHYKASQRHRHFRDCARNCADKLKRTAWTLHHENATLRKGMFHCEVFHMRGPRLVHYKADAHTNARP